MSGQRRQIANVRFTITVTGEDEMEQRGERPRRSRCTGEGSGQISPARPKYRASAEDGRKYDRGRSRRREAAAVQEAAEGWQQKLRARKRRKRNRILAGIGAGVLGIYIAVAIYFGFHFYEDTEIYGIDCSQETADTVKAEVAKRLGDYRLEIKERGGESEYLTAEQIKLAFVDDSSINGMLKAQKSFLWPVMILLKRSNAAAVAFSYDRDAGVLGAGLHESALCDRTGGCLCENDGHRL